MVSLLAKFVEMTRGSNNKTAHIACEEDDSANESIDQLGSLVKSRKGVSLVGCVVERHVVSEHQVAFLCDIS